MASRGSAVLALVATACAAPRAAPTSALAPDPAYARLEDASDLDGRSVGPLAGGQHATLVIVFASWCGHCRHELAVLGDLVRDEPALRVVGVNAYETWSQLSDETRLREFLASTAPWLRVVHGDEALLGALGGVPKIPSLFLFDRHGRLVEDWRRQERAPPDLPDLRAAIRLAAAR
jgi:thiol-disulfide isomerase/thioredoxin